MVPSVMSPPPSLSCEPKNMLSCCTEIAASVVITPEHLRSSGPRRSGARSTRAQSSRAQVLRAVLDANRKVGGVYFTKQLPDEIRAKIIEASSASALVVIARLDKRCHALAAPSILRLARLRGPPFNMKPAQIMGEETTLELRFLRLGPAGAATLALAAQTGATASLTRLDLESNNIGDKGAVALSAAVGSGALGALQTLRLPHNKVGDVGMLALCEAISRRRVRHLCTLSLGINRIGDAGVIALANTISGGAMGALVSLNLSTNLVSDRGLLALCDGPWRSKSQMDSLETLWLDSNRIGDAGCAALARVISDGGLAAVDDVYLDPTAKSGAVQEAIRHRKWVTETLAGGRIIKFV